MQKLHFIFIVSIVMCLGLASAPKAAAGSLTQGKEHQERPAREGSRSKAPSEHPVEKKPVTIESVAEFLEGYVAEEYSKHDGWMQVRDDRADKTLSLKLDKIHRDRLAKTAEGTYFVCADFKDPGGKAYDLDFWVKETGAGLAVTETMIHKEAGIPRYTWVEKGGVWIRRPVEGK
jgi:hypothetical protein